MSNVFAKAVCRAARKGNETAAMIIKRESGLAPAKP